MQCHDEFTPQVRLYLLFTFADTVHESIIVALVKVEFQHSSLVRIVVSLNVNRVIDTVQDFLVGYRIVVGFVGNLVKLGLCIVFLGYAKLLWGTRMG